MSDAQLRNLLIHVGLVAANIVVIALAAALTAGTLPGFRDGEALAPARAELTALLVLVGPIITQAIAASRTRLGSEGLAAEVDVYRERGYHRDDLTVVPRVRVTAPTGDAPAAPPAPTVALTGVDVQRVADELERRQRRTPAPTGGVTVAPAGQVRTARRQHAEQPKPAAPTDGGQA